MLNPNILESIDDCIDLTSLDYVLEIGPGMGALTQQLSKRAKKVVAIEIDRGIIPALEQSLGEQNNVEIIHGDFLKQDLNILHEKLGGGTFKVCANLPYYITTPIIMNLIMSELPCSILCFLIQKEVAQRMASKHGKKSYGSLSIAVQYHADIEIVMDVGRENFYPSPNVDSVVIKLTKKQKPPIEVDDKQMFFELTKACFVQRRKTLANNLSASKFNLSKLQAEQLLLSCEFKKDVRAEALSLNDFATLSNALGQFLLSNTKISQ